MPEKKPLIVSPTIGADVEVFLQDIKSLEVVTAEGIIRGTKYDPFRFGNNPFFATSLDNIMAEFSIPPAKTGEEFLQNISTSLNFISESIPKHLQIFAYPSAKVDDRYLQSETAKLFGCEPDFNAWDMGSMNERPESTTNIRSCGGHIHVGYENPGFMINLNLIKAMDIFIGLPSIIQEPDNDRKSLYGRAGAFRNKEYGAEYRTVSNYYVNSPDLTKWVFNNTLSAIDFVNNETPIDHLDSLAIQEAINTANKELAEKLCNKFNVKLAA